MNRSTLVPFLVLLGACASDYKVHADPDRNDGTDTGDVIPDDPTDTAPPEDTSEPDDEAGRPIAVCSVAPNPVTPPFEAATWDGSGSYDPDGLTIDRYRWTLLSQPDGSTLSISGSGATSNPFTPQIAGTYTGQLVVTNSAGVDSNPCTVDLEAVPAEDLWIEMYWQFSGDDMDLHLLAPGRGTSSMETSWDCYYANCVGSGLNWGGPGREDNPTLDLDDIPGTGPENINIEAPENGTYTVVVHDYPGSTYSGANNVTINIYLDGALEWTDTRAISGENSYTTFAEVDYATRTVTTR